MVYWFYSLCPSCWRSSFISVSTYWIQELSKCQRVTSMFTFCESAGSIISLLVIFNSFTFYSLTTFSLPYISLSILRWSVWVMLLNVYIIKGPVAPLPVVCHLRGVQPYFFMAILLPPQWQDHMHFPAKSSGRLHYDIATLLQNSKTS